MTYTIIYYDNLYDSCLCVYIILFSVLAQSLFSRPSSLNLVSFIHINQYIFRSKILELQFRNIIIADRQLKRCKTSLLFIAPPGHQLFDYFDCRTTVSGEREPLATNYFNTYDVSLCSYRHVGRKGVP